MRIAHELIKPHIPIPLEVDKRMPMSVISPSRLLLPPPPRPRGATHRTAAIYGHLPLPSPLAIRQMKCSRAAIARSSSQQNGPGEQEAAMDAASFKNEQQQQKEEEEKAEEDLRSAAVTASEIKERLAALRAKEGASSSSDLWAGVAEEIREIEWPAFRKVLGTTGVVLAVIAGSSVALLTVNAVLAEISDRVFAGKGLQDFF